jgi:transcriptional regulator with XRE-family HTH domain
MSFSAAQCRAARALIGWSQDDLSVASKVAKATIANFELGKRQPYARTLADLREALESVGVELTNGGDPGVKLRRFRPGDLVRLRPLANVGGGFLIAPGEIGKVTQVEPHPSAMGPTYRMWVQFANGTTAGVFSFEFRLVKRATEGAEDPVGT